MSCKQTSNAALAKIKPVNPPTVNNIIKAKANIAAGVNTIALVQAVANQLKILTPVGIAIIIVVVVKNALESTSIPTVYM